MFSILGKPGRLCDGLSRREMLRIGGIGLSGLSLADLLNSPARATGGDRQFGRAKNVIFLWLQGGPPQHETFDPKPEAPAEVRGPFKPIATNVPGIQISELLPRTAAMADKYAIVRSLVTGSNIHSASGYYVLTGYPYRGPNPRQISPTDWPYFGSIVKMLKPSETLPAYSTVWLPDVMRLNDNVMPSGQTAGFLGTKWEPEKVVWDPASADAQVEQFRLPPDVSQLRLGSRRSLLDQLNEHFRSADRSGAIEAFGPQVQEAFSVLTTGRALAAFDIEKEPARTRERFGGSKWGQCLLLARRLIEAGVRLVHVNWLREEGDNAVDNPMWDTHAQNADRLQDVLCPQFDIGFTALLEDLDQRGLLDETLVVAVGEFGRTPKINSQGGRDHWGNVSNFVIAGAGIQTAQVIGRSDAVGGTATADRVEPKDLTATLFHLLGINHDLLFRDRLEIPHAVTQGAPIHKLFGSGPATAARREPEGDLAFVPAYTTEKLRNRSFEDDVPLHPVGGDKRRKGWQAVPLAGAEASAGLAVRLLDGPGKSTGKKGHCAAIGIGLGDPTAAVDVPQGARAILSQEIRNPRSGDFTFSVLASGGGTSAAWFEEVFLMHFKCRLTLFRFSDSTKDVRRSQFLAESEFRPAFSDDESPQYERFEVSQFLGTTV
ncbi:MAG TPA: DUF1501 domain-containing protein, partial [Pirellulales bacterium]|nr:DUF1501 domain-containing protein [Pirellulales bacterium]